ncbi:MAG: eukaryotic-like serine/threonine-protein kinase [Actinoplanes sp.]|nr:eukaryotic-like serine/threonine-protein kinase [Actinoplanes sp.]
MTQVGEGHETAADEPGPVMTFGAPTVGEILAERYQLEEHVNNDSAGRQVWRGIDVILRRPVAVVLRYPGGDSATEMLQAAVDASRVIHPNLVGVYDAIDEDDRAYVVREWVEGEALRDLVGVEGPLDPARATAIAHSIADALAAVHATGMVHGNVHPGTTLIGDDGRVVLADARADSADSRENDVRAVGGLLYYSLTARWPHAEIHTSTLPDANRDAGGAIAAPRQIRAGIPAYLDDLTMDLLDKRVAAPEADALAAELARLDSPEEEYEEVGPLRFTQSTSVEPTRSTRKIMVGVGALVVIAIIGLVFGIRAIGASKDKQSAGSTAAGVATAPAGNNASADPGTPTPQKIQLTSDMVRIVDPPNGSRVDTGEAAFTVDNNSDTAWETQHFKQSNFGNNKAGMGVLINLGRPRSVSDVQVETSAPGVSMELRWGTSDPGDNTAGDDTIVKTYKVIGERITKSDGTNQIFPVSSDQQYQFLLVFLTDLPAADDGSGGFKVSVNKIQVDGS